MEKVELFDKCGSMLTEINIKSKGSRVDGIQWGGKVYIWNHTHKQFREGDIVPGIIEKKTR
jgi:hypothetical protein